MPIENHLLPCERQKIRSIVSKYDGFTCEFLWEDMIRVRMVGLDCFSTILCSEQAKPRLRLNYHYDMSEHKNYMATTQSLANCVQEIADFLNKNFMSREEYETMQAENEALGVF